MFFLLRETRVFLFRKRNVFPCLGMGFTPCQALGFSFQETRYAPHFFFSLPEKKKRAAPGAKKKRGFG